MAFVFKACMHPTLRYDESKTPNHDAAAADSLRGAVEILEDRLYFMALRSHPRTKHFAKTGKPIHFFHVDSELVYWNFFLDFGPLNLGQLYRFSTKLNRMLETLEKDHVICFYTSTNSAKRANGIYLICSWQVLYLNRTPEEAYHAFTFTTNSNTYSQLENSSKPPKVLPSITTCAVPPWHDASPTTCTYELTIMDCLHGLALAHQFRFFDFQNDNFDLDEYEHFEQVENGDLNWIIKDRILAFAGPSRRSRTTSSTPDGGYSPLTPSDYIPYFKKKNVTLVVRLNRKLYDKEEFTNAGIAHVEQYYLDGSCPPLAILQNVLTAFESVDKSEAFAVHCKAGLGRTGTCIGAFIMKHYQFTAPQAIAWMRICRPGMVIGPQQQFLQDIEQRMWHEGRVMKLRPIQDEKLAAKSAENYKRGSPKSVVQSPLHFGSLTMDDDAESGRPGQADSLLAARRNPQSSSRMHMRRLFQ